jgi:tRNA-2-methylthio-N6-dimethylallyladenosine synthase
MKDKHYHIIAFGCQMNISDAERVAAVLESAGYKAATDISKADLIAVVMCSIRQSAVDRVHWLVEKFKKLRKKPATILTGCVLKTDKKVFIKGFDFVVDIREIKQLPSLLARQQIRSVPRKAILHGSPKAKNCRELSEPRAGEASASEELLSSDYLSITPKYSSKFSASVPIMTGCNNFCAYCVVPYAREREVSRPAKDILHEIKNLTNPTSPRLRGAREIWLLGQNVNSYNDGKTNFPELLKLVNKLPREFWI